MDEKKLRVWSDDDTQQSVSWVQDAVGNLFSVRASPGNTTAIHIGDESRAWVTLEPGDSYIIPGGAPVVGNITLHHHATLSREIAIPPMDPAEQAIRSILPSRGEYSISRRGNVIDVHVESDVELTFELLQQLADALGTKAINIRYDHGTPDWSDLTPGERAEFTIEITLSESNG
jgi:hypothetical protein